jgi:hypothetical protein
MRQHDFLFLLQQAPVWDPLPLVTRRVDISLCALIFTSILMTTVSNTDSWNASVVTLPVTAARSSDCSLLLKRQVKRARSFETFGHGAQILFQSFSSTRTNVPKSRNRFRYVYVPVCCAYISFNVESTFHVVSYVVCIVQIRI